MPALFQLDGVIRWSRTDFLAFLLGVLCVCGGGGGGGGGAGGGGAGVVWMGS